MNYEVYNAGLYIRVSTEYQVKEGFSVQAQKESLIKYALNHNMNIFDMYADEGISAKNLKDRPEVIRLIKDIKERNVNVVLLYKFDRLTRDSRDTEDIIDLISKYGIDVMTISQGIVDVSTASGRFMTRISGAQAQFEREQIIERVKFGNCQKVKDGYTLASAVTCYGYNRKKRDKNLTINQKEARIVKRIFNMYTKENKSLSEICTQLNNEQVPTKKSGLKQKNKVTNEVYKLNPLWMPKTIRLILTNPIYIGKVRYHIGKKDGFIADGKHKAIIAMKLWRETQDKIAKRKHISRTNFPKEDVYYCGTLKCGICGHKLTTNRTVKTKKDGTKVTFLGYRCINREKKICSCMGMSHKKVEEQFLKYLENIENFTETENIKTEEKSKETLEEINILQKNLSKVTSKKKEVMHLFLFDKITHRQFIYMNEELEKQGEKTKLDIENRKQKIRVSQKRSNKIEPRIKEHWKHLTDKERLTFLEEFVEEIVIVNKNTDKIKGKPDIIDVKFYE